MGMFSRRDTFDSLEDLLDKERAAILSGNFGTLSRLMAEKERLLRAVGAPGSARGLARIKQKADRNQAMLHAASRGVRAAADSLKKSAAGARPLKTYDRSGQRRDQAPARSNTERRA